MSNVPSFSGYAGFQRDRRIERAKWKHLRAGGKLGWVDSLRLGERLGMFRVRRMVKA